MKINRATLLILCLITFSSCGGGSGSSPGPETSSPETSSTDTTAPIATITFPPAQSLTDGDSIIVRGTASDAGGSGVAVVRVNGIDVSTTDNFTTWSTVVPLSPGNNTLTVETMDITLNSDLAAASVNIIGQDVALDAPLGIVIDETNRRALVVGNELRAIVAIDLTPGESLGRRTILSGDTKGDGPSFVSPNSIALDTDNNRALVVDNGLDAILEVDLVSGPTFGNRTIISDQNNGSGPNLQGPQDITLDILNNRVFVIDAGLEALVEINLITGNRNIISSNSIGNGPELLNPLGIAYDSDKNQILTFILISFQPALIAIDLASGDRSIVTTDFALPISIELDRSSNKALIVDQSIRAIIEIDLSPGINFGNTQVISGNNISNSPSNLIGNGPTLNQPRDISLDISNNRALVVDSFTGIITSIDLSPGVAFGDRNIVSASSTGNGVNIFPSNIDIDVLNNQAFLIDQSLGSSIVRIDLTPDTNFGDREIISASNTVNLIGSGVNLISADSISLDINNNRALVTDQTTESVIVIDLATGDREKLSDSSLFTGPRTNHEEIIVTDSENNRAFIFSEGIADLSVIDLTPGQNFGNRSRISNGDILFDFPIQNAVDLALDSDNNRVLALLSFFGDIISVDITSGEVDTVFDAGIGGDIDFLAPTSFALDSINNRILVIDQALRAVIAIDLTTGERSVVSDNRTPNDQNSLNSPIDIAYDPVNNRALVTENDIGSVVIIDLTDGQRVVGAR